MFAALQREIQLKWKLHSCAIGTNWNANYNAKYYIRFTNVWIYLMIFWFASFYGGNKEVYGIVKHWNRSTALHCWIQSFNKFRSSHRPLRPLACRYQMRKIVNLCLHIFKVFFSKSALNFIISNFRGEYK